MSQNLYSKSIDEIIENTWGELRREHRFLPGKGKENVDALIQAIERKIEKEIGEMQSAAFTEFDRINLTRKRDCIIKEEIERYRQYYERKSETDADYGAASETVP